MQEEEDLVSAHRKQVEETLDIIKEVSRLKMVNCVTCHWSSYYFAVTCEWPLVSSGDELAS